MVSRTERLFDLLQLLRQHRYPVAGQALADKLGVSLRTIYRDIATLIAQGAVIEGERLASLVYGDPCRYDTPRATPRLLALGRAPALSRPFLFNCHLVIVRGNHP